MLANLLAVPNTEADWSIFSFNNRLEVDRINEAILKQKGVNLPQYPLDPINFNQIYTWLAYNAQAHIAFNGVLGLQSNDLLAVDLRDVRQRVSWIFQNYLEVQSAQNALDI